MTIRFYNTLTRAKENFEALDDQHVTMYLCGPTVYNYAHIGNARPAVVFDVLYRLLKHSYPRVTFARNVTDVDDKIITASEKTGIPISQITQKYTDIYNEDMGALGVLPPDIEPRATEHIPEMIDMISKLISSGHAYESDGHVLFDVTAYDDYGKLSNRTLEDMLAGARVEVADYKNHPSDFVLWKPSTDDQIGWDSPWGRGRPGWHIECSAMIGKHLGKTIDIHCGGIDLVFPHHENEIAQSCCANDGQPYVRYWLHNGFLTMDSEKMAKSVGNVYTVNDLRKDYHPEVLRLVLLSAHYRQPLDWNDQVIHQAQDRLDRIYCTLRNLEDIDVSEAGINPPQALIDALSDDLNTPSALAVLAEHVNQANRAATTEQKQQAKAALLGCGQLMGLLQYPPAEWLQGNAADSLDTADIDALVAERDTARAERNFQRADEIRDQLADMGIIIEDGADGSRWRADR